MRRSRFSQEQIIGVLRIPEGELVYLRARFGLPAQGRFLTRDTFGGIWPVRRARTATRIRRKSKKSLCTWQ